MIRTPAAALFFGRGGMDLFESAEPEVDGSAIASAAFFTVKPSELHLRSLLGRGAQAEVYKADWTRNFTACKSTVVVAVKRLHEGLGPIYRDREALGLITDHANLVKCFDATVDPPYLIVTEYCAGGTLFDLLYNTRQEIALPQRIKIMLDIAAGMKYLHSQRPCILHRDLKSSNILLMQPVRSLEQMPFAKVADFGLARTAGGGSMWAMTKGVGTWRWMAPEVFELHDNDAYDERADVFSFAMVMYEVLFRKMPYIERFPEDSNDPRIGMHVCMGLRPSTDGMSPDFPPQLLELVQQAWSGTPAERPTFTELEEALKALLATLQPAAAASQ